MGEFSAMGIDAHATSNLLPTRRPAVYRLLEESKRQLLELCITLRRDHQRVVTGCNGPGNDLSNFTRIWIFTASFERSICDEDGPYFA